MVRVAYVKKLPSPGHSIMSWGTGPRIPAATGFADATGIDYCCGDMDCFPVACDQLVETVSGWLYVSQPATCSSVSKYSRVRTTIAMCASDRALFAARSARSSYRTCSDAVAQWRARPRVWPVARFDLRAIGADQRPIAFQEITAVSTRQARRRRVRARAARDFAAETVSSWQNWPSPLPRWH